MKHTGQKKTLTILDSMKIGLSKSIRTLLEDYELPTEFTIIKNLPYSEWKNKVKSAIEKKNTARLNEECYKQVNGVRTRKTKTATIADKIADRNYKHKPQKELIYATKQETKTMIIARYGMLECGKNFKGSFKQMCEPCNEIDDENHRINHCIKLKGTNLYDSSVKVNFDLIHCDDIDVLRGIMPLIETIWNTKTAHGTIKTD